VSYRPYLAASAALHKLLASREMAKAIQAAIVDANVADNDAADADVDADADADTDADARGAGAAGGAVQGAPGAGAGAVAGAGVVIEKASIDEAYVQLPASSILATAAPAAAAAVRDLVKRRLDIVLSVGAAHNKLLAKLASVASKPNGVLVVATEQDVAALLARTPAAKLPGCGGAVAPKLQTELGARVASDLAGVPPARLTAGLYKSNAVDP
jgi:hypothetical protein